ncbi:AI-2E family transporter [Roseococcus sp. SYP-B2431]|uniref:AI-2E family transporter n=1 Tax=Roseococcus sp. SYP-B2431 TaxID=2496640 RepID=UPI00103ED240|nr:AI-2E family transporter [Roseococcus sp. SYP-B2431]TCH96152.1 AI-2E family transporter [Roseococcus sp. SYP-B2431]
MAPFRPPAPVSRDWPSRLLIFAAVIAALYLGREVFAPLALALLLTIAAMPAVSWLERRSFPRVAAVLLVMALFLAIVGGLVYVVLTQAMALAAELPNYENVLREKLQSISQDGSGPIDGVMRLAKRLGEVLAPAQATPTQTVAVAASDQGPLSTLFGLAVVIIAPVATFAITLLLMAFILIQREDVRDRVLRLAGLHEMHRTTGAMADATARVGRFLLMQAMVNGIFGLSMGIGLWLLGVPNAPLWGALGFALRFVPFLGAPLSMLFPLIVAFATTEGWATVLLVIALFAFVDVTVTYVLEPWLYGSSMGITPLALLLASAFWAVMWGPLGLILAPAITACLVILGRHVRTLAFLDVLLGDTPPLPAPARFYQRLLADDALNAAALLGTEAGRIGVESALDQMVMPAIAQISTDRPNEAFGPALAIRASRALTRVMEAVSHGIDGPADILVLPVAGALDRAAAAAVVVALQEVGQLATLTPAEASDPTLVVLVAATDAPPRRLDRALASARQLSDQVLIFAPTDEAAGGLHRRPGITPLPTLPGLLAEVEAAMTGGVGDPVPALQPQA